MSGLVGALAATLVASAVAIWREQIRLRGGVALEIADWLEGLRTLRNQYFTARTALESALQRKSQDSALRWEQRWHDIGDRLVVLAQSNAPFLKVVIAHGEGELSTALEDLHATIRRLVSEEMRILEAQGLQGLGTQEIRALRHDVDEKQEPLLKQLVRSGSVPEVLRRTWKGEPLLDPSD